MTGPASVRLVLAARPRGFSLIEVLVAVLVVAVLAAVALPSYQQSIRRSSREAAQAQLLELAGLQEKIFLNANAFSSDISSAYNGNASGGLGATTGRTADGRYTLSVSVSGASYTLTARPVSGTTQAGDGNLSIDSTGKRTWGDKAW